MAAKKKDGGAERATGRAKAQQVRAKKASDKSAPHDLAAKNLGRAAKVGTAVVAASYGAQAIRNRGISKEMKNIEKAVKKATKVNIQSGNVLRDVYGRTPGRGEQFPRGATPSTINQWVNYQSSDRKLSELARRQNQLTRFRNKLAQHGGFTSNQVRGLGVNPKRVDPPRGGRIGGGTGRNPWFGPRPGGGRGILGGMPPYQK